MPPSFLFWQPSIIQRRHVMPTTLDNLHRADGDGGCAFSSADASMLELAAGLALRGCEVRVLSGGPAVRPQPCTPPNTHTIKYLSPERTFLDTPEQQAGLTRVDVFVVVYMMPEAPAHAEMMDVLRRLANPQLRVLCWCHMVYQDAHLSLLRNACAHRGLPMTLVCVSDFVRYHLRDVGVPSVTISDAVNPDIFGSDGDEREAKSVVFCTSYERGGRIAREVHSLLMTRTAGMGEMHVCSTLSKRALASRLRRSDYMVYPLVLDGGSVHHDTFACGVLEAMASGVLVVSWDVACLRTVFGDLITLLPPPPSPGYDGRAPGGSNAAMLEPAAVAALADAMTSLMALPKERREARRDAARAWALRQTWDRRVGDLLQAVRR